MTDPAGVHLVGSIPLSSTEEVFTKICQEIPSRLQTLPDGETGDRYRFVDWQTFVFPPGILRPDKRDGPLQEEFEPMLDDIKPTKYFEANVASYRTFQKLREQGIIPPGIRFQVSLPTPVNACFAQVDYLYRSKVEPLYMQRLIQDLKSLEASIPTEDLAIQIDCAIEMGYLEYERGRLSQSKLGYLDRDPTGLISEMFKPHPSLDPLKEMMADGVVELASAVDPGVLLGIHLCYGDRGHEHFVQPKDASLLVEMANAILERVSRQVQWIHMPVPKERTDVDYFKPLQGLKLGATKLYLGLVHARDQRGTEKRIKVAQSVYGHSFGIATECGMGRTAREDLDSILSISEKVSAPVRAG
ncbi:MAG: hypothetical protein Q9165_006884 [Trypethelium subeluteriae]